MASVRSPDNGSAERLLSAGMVARLMWRGARPSIETTSTGEGETVVTVMIRLRDPTCQSLVLWSGLRPKENYG